MTQKAVPRVAGRTGKGLPFDGKPGRIQGKFDRMPWLHRQKCVGLYGQHIAREKAEPFPMAAHLLSDVDRDRIRQTVWRRRGVLGSPEALGPPP